MTATGSLYGAVTYATESAFGEDVDTVATRLPVLGPVNISGITQPRIDPGITRQYMNDGGRQILGVHGGSFTTEHMLTGAGASCASAVPTVTELITLLGYVFGVTASSAASGTTLTGGTAAAPTTTASNTFSNGALCRVGALQDGDGEGQVYAISNHAATTLNLLTALQGAPVNGAVLYTGRMVYPTEDPVTGAVVQSLRFQLHTSNYQVLCHGCFPTSVSFSGYSPSQQPKISITWGYSWHEYKASTFPVTASVETFAGMTTAAGSLFVNDVGTTTNSRRTGLRDFEWSINTGIVPLMGVGGVHAYQGIVGAVRTQSEARVSWTEDAGVASTSPTWQAYSDTDPNSIALKHALYTVSTTDGRAHGIYFPRLEMVDQKPAQADMNGVNAVKSSWKALTSTVTTSALTLSSWRMYFG